LAFRAPARPPLLSKWPPFTLKTSPWIACIHSQTSFEASQSRPDPFDAVLHPLQSLPPPEPLLPLFNMPVNEKEMKVLKQKGFKVGDRATDHQNHEGEIKAVLTDEDDTPSPPKLLFAATLKDGTPYEKLHFPSALNKVKD
jgi:hypothetical protein